MFQALWTNIMHHNMTSLHKSNILYTIWHAISYLDNFILTKLFTAQFYWAYKAAFCCQHCCYNRSSEPNNYPSETIWQHCVLPAMIWTIVPVPKCIQLKMYLLRAGFTEKTQTFQTRPFHFTINIKTVIHKQSTL